MTTFPNTTFDFFINSFQPIAEFEAADFRNLIKEYSAEERALLINFLKLERLKRFDYTRTIVSFCECPTTKDIFCVCSCPFGATRGVFVICRLDSFADGAKPRMTHDEALQSADQLLECCGLLRSEVTKQIFSSLIDLFAMFSITDEICVLFPDELFSIDFLGALA